MSVRADAETLRAIPIFADCDSVPLQVLAFSSERQVFERGEPLLKQGFNGAPAYLILSGAADIHSDGKLVGQAGPGALLGEVSMIGQLPCTISATATSVVTAARLSRAVFLRLSQEYPEFGQAVFAALARKLDASLRDLTQTKEMFDKARSFTRS